jgi:hypothetical protein
MKLHTNYTTRPFISTATLLLNLKSSISNTGNWVYSDSNLKMRHPKIPRPLSHISPCRSITPLLVVSNNYLRYLQLSVIQKSLLISVISNYDTQLYNLTSRPLSLTLQMSIENTCRCLQIMTYKMYINLGL